MTLTNVANLIVPMLADWCARRRRAATDCRPHSPWRTSTRRRCGGRGSCRRSTRPIPTRRRGRRTSCAPACSELYAEITDEMLVAGARDEEHLRLSRELNLRSALVVPLSPAAATLGAMTLIRTDDSARRTTETDLAFAEDSGAGPESRSTTPSCTAQTQDVALQLQRAVLPGRARQPPGLGGRRALRAGWARRGRRRLLRRRRARSTAAWPSCIGDVMGHGVRAAAAMAQMRSAVRAYLSIDPDPAVVVAKLDIMFASWRSPSSPRWCTAWPISRPGGSASSTPGTTPR